MLQAKPGTVVECGGWNAYDQAVRDGAAIARIRTERCRDVERTPTGVEHGLLQDEKERARKPAVQDAGDPPPERRPRSRYDAVDRLVSSSLRLTEASGRIVRAAARRHRVANTRTIERALFVTGNPNRDQLLGAAGWTTKDRLRHDPLACSPAARAPKSWTGPCAWPGRSSTPSPAPVCRPSPSATTSLPPKAPDRAASPENGGARPRRSPRSSGVSLKYIDSWCAE